jgi:hypothetical protein
MYLEKTGKGNISLQIIENKQAFLTEIALNSSKRTIYAD